MTERGKRWAADAELKMRTLAAKALEGSDLGRIMELAGTAECGAEAGEVLKAVLAERIAEYTMKAMQVARKRKIGLGAAAMERSCRA